MTLVSLLLLACGGGAEDARQPAVERPQLQVGAKVASPVAAEPDDAVLKRSDCDTVTSEPLADGACITGTLSCGDEVVGHTVGGTHRFGTRFYEAFYCTPATTNHDDGHERVYVLEMPEGDHHAQIRLDTPCADLDLAAFRWEDEGCPDLSSRIDVCEMNRAEGTRRESVRISSRGPTRWLVVVEGEGTDEGAFGLRVECAPGL